MRRYVLTAKVGNNVTSIPINARDDFCAKVQSVKEINKRYVSDKRWEKGEITLKGQYGDEVIMHIKGEEE